LFVQNRDLYFYSQSIQNCVALIYSLCMYHLVVFKVMYRR